MRKKLKGQSGETLIEALISLLIAVLSMGIVSSAVISASRINEENRKRDEEYKKQLYEAEAQATPMGNPNAEVKVEFSESVGGSSIYHIDVLLYGGDENPFVSYVKKPEEM